MDSYLWELPQFDHSPLRAPRDGMIGEQVYAQHWAKQMETKIETFDPPNAELAGLLHNMGEERITQRHATVAASMVCWLGTNCGGGFLHNAKRVAESQIHRDDAYLMAWSVQNARIGYSNYGIRTLEHCLVPDGAVPLGGYVSSKSFPVLTAADLETAEHVARWLGSDDGQKFILKCQIEIKKRQKEESFRHHCENNLKLTVPQIEVIRRLANKY